MLIYRLLIYENLNVWCRRGAQGESREFPREPSHALKYVLVLLPVYSQYCFYKCIYLHFLTSVQRVLPHHVVEHQ